MIPKWLQKWAEKNITAVIDTREQMPLDLKKYCPDLELEYKALAHGDYSLCYPNLVLDVCIERKSIDDLVQSIKKECAGEDTINNFKKTLLAMRGYKYKLVVVEASLKQVINGEYSSGLNPKSVLGFISYWMGIQGIPFLFAESHAGASYVVANMLYNIAERELKLSLLSNKIFPEIALERLDNIGRVDEDDMCVIPSLQA